MLFNMADKSTQTWCLQLFIFLQVEWTFLSAIFISKASLFLMIGIFTLIIRRPTNIGLAALAGIFVTQSNDFALGYPIGK